jgi:hypothetical protein
MDTDRTHPDPRTAPWPHYAEAVIELILDGHHLVLTPLPQTGATATPASGPADLLAHAGGPTWVLTAGDPYPVELTPEENAVREQQLCAELDAAGLRHDPALGRSPDGSVSERSRALRGVDRAAVLGIAARHGQLAVYEIAEGIACVEVASGTVVTRRDYELKVAPADGTLVGPTGWNG